MKRYGNLYPQIIEFQNIFLAARKAQKGKRFREQVLPFNYNLETELIKIQQDLENKTYQPGEYRTFHIREPKLRMISAAPYRDYVDDFALFADDWGFLAEARVAIEEYLAQLRLKIHPIKSQLFQTKQGVNFLGFRIFTHRIRVRTENLRRARRRLSRMRKDHAQGKMSQEKVSQSIQSWFAHLEHGDTRQLRQKIFTSLAWARE